MYYNDPKKMLEKKLKIIKQNQSLGTDCEMIEPDSLYHRNVPRINKHCVQNSFASNNTTIHAPTRYQTITTNVFCTVSYHEGIQHAP